MDQSLYRFGDKITSAVYSFGAELNHDEFNTLKERLLDIDRAIRMINGNDGRHELASSQVIAVIVYQYLKELKKL
jgi:hypothetical protein